MATFRYQAIDAAGRPVNGQLEAASADEALALLRERQLQPAEVLLLSGDDSVRRPTVLNVEDAEEFAQMVAQLSNANLSLAVGLRAGADEASNRRVAHALRWLADRIDQGQTLPDALRTADKLVPRSLRGLILAAAGTGRLGQALAEVTELHRSNRALRRAIFATFAYPVAILFIAAVVLLFITVYLSGVFEKMFVEFALILPLLTQWLFWFRHTGIWVIAGFLGIVLLCVLVYRLFVGRAKWQQQMATMPLFGPLWHGLAVAEWAGLMGILLRHNIPLPEALRMTADGVGSNHVRNLSVTLANGVATGRSLSQLLASGRGMPRSLAPLVRWGEQTNTLADALTTGSDMYQNRVRRRSLLLQSILPPGMFIALGGCILFVVVSLFIPLVSLVQGLSS